MYLIFDPETTGFPLPDFQDANNPRLIQSAWALINEDGKPFKKFESLIEPCGWEMPSIDFFIKKGFTEEQAKEKAKFWIEHGYSQEKSLKEGRPIEFAIKHFIEAIEESKYMIAHNLKFDLAIMASEMYRLKKSAVNKPVKFCTMKETTDLLKLPNTKGSGYKWPTLTELHQFLFKKGFDGAHDAMADVKACANCFFTLKKQKLITLPPYEQKT